jgi:hypothetical protein
MPDSKSSSPKTVAATRLSTAARLLVKLMDTGLYSREQLARRLIVSPEMLDAFLSGALAIPLDRQAALARLLVDRVPSLARAGRRLHGQVEAAIAYESGETKRHSTSSRPTNVW